MRSPIWTARPASDRTAQVLAEELLHRLYGPDDRKLICFSDSRQDAAKLAGGLDVAHYRDTVRQLVAGEVARAARAAGEFTDYRTWLEDRSRTDLAPLARRLRRESQLARELGDLHDGLVDDPADVARIRAAEAQALAGAASLSALVVRLFEELASVGRDPAGPAGRTLTGNRTWYGAYQWPDGPDDPRPPRPRDDDPAAAQYLAAVRGRVRVQLAAALFFGAGRDAESLGLGHVAPAAGHAPPPPPGVGSPDVAQQLICGLVRKLGLQRFYEGQRQERDPDAGPPRAVGTWLQAAADRCGADYDQLVAWARAHLAGPGGCAERWLLRMDRLVVVPGGEQAWRCAQCSWVHLHRNAGACQHCHRPMTYAESVATADLRAGDYYASLAAEGRPVTRMNVEELTGQTGRDLGQRRQALFQGIFLAAKRRCRMASTCCR